MYCITFQPPYSNGAWVTESYDTEEEAVSMIAFYLSCGTKAKFV